MLKLNLAATRSSKSHDAEVSEAYRSLHVRLVPDGPAVPDAAPVQRAVLSGETMYSLAKGLASQWNVAPSRVSIHDADTGAELAGPLSLADVLSAEALASAASAAAPVRLHVRVREQT